MTEKQPTDDASTRIKRHDHFRAERVKRAAKLRSLCLMRRLRKIGAGDQMRVQFEPAHQRVALAEFHLVRFRQTAQAGAEPITIPLSNLRKNSDARHAGGIRDAFHNTGEKYIDIVELAKHARETQQSQRWPSARRGGPCAGSGYRFQS